MPPEIGYKIGLPPTETVEFFRAKGRVIPTSTWLDLWQEEHARAFTVSGINDVNVLQSVRASLDVMLDQGGTFGMWKAGILPELTASAQNGTSPPNILTDRRLRIIYDTNLRMAVAAGQWKRIQANKVSHPFLMYSAIHDRRTRPLHKAWDGTVLPVDHPWWDTHYPPCGWNCRCNIIQYSQRDLDRLGLKVVKNPPNNGEMYDYIRKDGVIQSVPRGIDPGFAYNVGKAHLAGVSDSLRDTINEVAKSNLPMARAVLRDIVESTAFDAFLVNEQQSFPVMVLGQLEREILGTETSVAILSSDTYAKQLLKHPELSLDVYRKLLDLGEAPEIIFKQNDQHIILLKMTDDKWLRATLEVTADGKEVYIVSYFIAREAEVERLRRTLKVIYQNAR